ncbi:primosomal protein DnaI [Paenibacillus cellulosilyticus]|uniref:Primosomal protein DnaI n=1 Tax=Paenibacillus cellulosilyticus TaxID=375489 RepID=A0A2V2YJJ0_9BACL|nr:primosomal protein DnaI [Paenibacillus cellulosilyticus]PWV92449.1 primosomal protein DnaI [Paenibacillus cellulosilyticus]QKS47025.1 primosomal protein DnaI [Paenibacillus cellulosilyticus]
MESLGELLKRTPMGSEALRRSAELMDGLLADPLVERFRAKYPELDNNTIRLNLNRFYQYVKEYRNCERCPGLDLCPNDFEGHYTMLSCENVNGEVRLYDRKVSCKKFIARQNEEQIRSRVRSFYIDETALRNGYSAEEIITNDLGRMEAVGQLLEYIDRTKEQGLQPSGLYLEGHFGTGKTFLMCYMLHELAKAGYSGVIVYMPDFVEDLKAMMHEPGKLKETVDMMKETDLLIFDDIGAENLSPWVRDHVMGGILNYRMQRKPTFYTSNLDIEALEQHFSFTSKEGDDRHKGERLMERIRSYVDVIRVTGTNKRKR